MLNLSCHSAPMRQRILSLHSHVYRACHHEAGLCLAAQMIAWTQDFSYNCRELGLSDEQAAFSTADNSGIALLISEYASRTYEMLHNWSVNILQVSGRAVSPCIVAFMLLHPAHERSLQCLRSSVLTGCKCGSEHTEFGCTK